MKQKLTAGSIIKKFITVRGKTIKEVAQELDIPYTTFSGRLNRDSIDAHLLFRLATHLDIDLNWMANILYQQVANPLAPLQIPRMQPELRSHDLPIIERLITLFLDEYPTSLADARNALLKEYHIYYLLDVLLPDEYNILTITERSKEKYYCISTINENLRLRSPLISSVEGREMLDRLIAERK